MAARLSLDARVDVKGLAEAARAAGRLGIDTEFMSEGRYRALLCLVGVVVPGADGPEGSGEPQGGAPVNREGSGEPQGGAPVNREGSGEPQGGAPVDRGSTRPAAISVGTNPQFGTERRVEAHVLDFDGDLYGHRVSVDFTHHLRGQAVFTGTDELIAQMHADIDQARRLLASPPGGRVETGGFSRPTP